MGQKEAILTQGLRYAHGKKLKKRLLSDCLSTAAFEEGFIINKDGSLALGFELTLAEEEYLSQDSFVSVIDQFNAAACRLPVGTFIQKMDIYWQDTCSIPIPDDAPFFHRKTLLQHDGKKFLKHKCVLFLSFFSQSLSPTSTFLALGSKLFNTPLTT